MPRVCHPNLVQPLHCRAVQYNNAVLTDVPGASYQPGSMPCSMNIEYRGGSSNSSPKLQTHQAQHSRMIITNQLLGATEQKNDSSSILLYACFCLLIPTPFFVRHTKAPKPSYCITPTQPQLMGFNVISCICIPPATYTAKFGTGIVGL